MITVPKQGGLNNKHLFLTVIEDGKSTIQVPTEPASWFIGGHHVLSTL